MIKKHLSNEQVGKADEHLSISRREFLEVTAKGVGATALGATGATVLAGSPGELAADEAVKVVAAPGATVSP